MIIIDASETKSIPDKDSVETMSIEQAINIALRMYTGEPCRICGEEITMDDIDNGAVFAGYNEDNAARSAHRECWEKHGDRLMVK